MSFKIEEATVVAESEKAICVSASDLDEETWIPKSQIHDDSEVWKNGQEGDLIVTDWWARKQGWD